MQQVLHSLLLLVSCQKANPPTPSVDQVVDTGASHDSATNTDTSATPPTETADTGRSSLPSLPVAVHTTIRGRTAAELGREWDEFIGDHLALVGDVLGHGHPALSTNGLNEALFFSGLPGGEVTTEAASARIAGGWSIARGAGDADGDGHDDVWVFWRLYRGPLPALTDHDTGLVAMISGTGVAGKRVEGGFDADGDGHTDAVAFSNNHQAVVHYGPFLAGEVRRGWYDDDVDPSILTEVQTGCGNGEDHETGWVWPDLFGAGHTALAVGNGDNGGLCSNSVYIFDLTGPRGRRLGIEDARIWSYDEGIWPGGDHDGDGVQDLFEALTFFGPVEGGFPEPDDQDPVQRFEPRSDVLGPTGDMNGDGRPELLVWVRDQPPGLLSEFWVVPSTHLGEDLPLFDIAVPVEVPPSVHFYFNHWVSGDLDGDGKAELIASNQSAEVGGRIYIWRGEDLLPDP